MVVLRTTPRPLAVPAAAEPLGPSRSGACGLATGTDSGCAATTPPSPDGGAGAGGALRRPLGPAGPAPGADQPARPGGLVGLGDPAGHVGSGQVLIDQVHVVSSGENGAAGRRRVEVHRVTGRPRGGRRTADGRGVRWVDITRPRSGPSGDDRGAACGR